MGTVEKLLREAGERVRLPEHRVRCKMATDAKGMKVEPTDAAAVRWCAVGAIQAGRDPYERAVARVILDSVAAQMVTIGSAISLNDKHNDLVPDLFSEAIEAAAELGL
jgi:hypothetical protein